MFPTSEAALVILLLAIAPGFITAAAWARARTWKGPAGDLRTIIQSLVLSAVVQALLMPLTVFWIVPIRNSLSRYADRLTVWSLLSVVVVPVMLGLASGAITDWIFQPAKDRTRFSKLANLAPTAPSAWDWLFTGDRVPQSAFLVLEFDNGSRVGGAYAGNSIALTSPEPHGLFLEREWQLDESGNLFCELPSTSGLLIPSTEGLRFLRILVAGQDAKELVFDGQQRGDPQEGASQRQG